MSKPTNYQNTENDPFTSPTIENEIITRNPSAI